MRIAYSLTFFLSNPSNPHAMKAPITNATRYINGFPIVGSTKIPPCGARSVQLNAMDNPPAVAEPIIQEGITLNGSFAANGIAPSEIKDNPIM